MSTHLITAGRSALRYGYVPFMLLGLGGAATALAAADAPKYLLIAVLVIGVAASFAAEQAIPYQQQWNTDHADTRRDRIHVLVNETLILLSVAAIPLLAAVNPWPGAWPTAWPFAAQVLTAVLVADLGITVVHLASHKIEWLWRFHAVHHSIKRLYGLNGLMKHPLHQAVEMTAGVAPLILIGMPVTVASALAVLTALQLMLQHSNADYRVGPLRYLLALNDGHRFHHLKWAGIGDVNFGLFTLIWDHAMGTYSYDPRRRFTSEQIGMAAKPNYPARYWPQLVYPFTAAGGCHQQPDRSRRADCKRSTLRSRGRRDSGADRGSTMITNRRWS
ncbi:sterol desaturase family protein [Mycolicibacterium grossiae]|uniref:sterol desaturase family protein n=1 Tax=Mycolicibacterium grossiae TaxID=1552759 RepID=UPI0009F1FBE6|nr:sterol desaturase family protein [Mycolicibacterium grossiae]